MRIVLIAVTLLTLSAPITLTGCGACKFDPAKTCEGKNDALLNGTQILPICGVNGVRKGDAPVYTWETPDGTCTCTLEANLNTGQNFWRMCSFK